MPRDPTGRADLKGGRGGNSFKHHRMHRQYAAYQAERSVRENRMHDTRQVRIHEPGPVGQRPRRRVSD